jgi:hypothetical protein
VPGRPLRPGERRGALVLSTARHQWDEGARRLAAEQASGARYRQLAELVDAVLDELRRRVGQTYTLTELAGAYERAEDWVREVVVDSTPPRATVGVRDTALVQDAAFGSYARGATDYRP